MLKNTQLTQKKTGMEEQKNQGQMDPLEDNPFIKLYKNQMSVSINNLLLECSQREFIPRLWQVCLLCMFVEINKLLLKLYTNVIKPD